MRSLYLFACAEKSRRSTAACMGAVVALAQVRVSLFSQNWEAFTWHKRKKEKEQRKKRCLPVQPEVGGIHLTHKKKRNKNNNKEKKGVSLFNLETFTWHKRKKEKIKRTKKKRCLAVQPELGGIHLTQKKKEKRTGRQFLRQLPNTHESKGQVLVHMKVCVYVYACMYVCVYAYILYTVPTCAHEHIL